MRLTKIGLALVLAALVATPALAQRQRQQPGGGRGFGPLSMLSNKSVQEELKITKEQSEKITELDKKLSEENRKAMEGLSQEERRGEKGRELRTKQREAANKALADVLKSDQMKRYEQINFQMRVLGGGGGFGFGGGFGGGRPGQAPSAPFMNPELAKALDLTDDQKADLKKLNESYQSDYKDATKDLGMGREAFQKIREARTKLNKSAMEKFNKVLTADQQKKLKELTGAPFEMKFEAPRRPDQQ